MKDLKAVLADKENEFRRVGNEVAALRIAMRLCDVAEDKTDTPEVPPIPPEPAKEPVKSWP